MTRFESDEWKRLFDQDLEALRHVSEVGLPSLDKFSTGLPQVRRPSTKEKLFMSFQFLKARPWLASTAAACLMTLVLLIVPISYQRTTGQEVRLKLPEGTEMSTADRVASELGRTLHTNQVSVLAGLNAEAEIVAHVSGRSAKTIRKEATSFARLLSERNIPASAEVRLMRETVSTSLLAYATGRILEIRVDGKDKTDAQLEEEIRAQLEAAGLQNAAVSVSRDGTQTQLTIHGEGLADGSDLEGINVTLDGATGAENRSEVRIQSAEKMTDAELKAEIERQLREKGVDADVTVTNGKISIQRPPR
jgi:type IV pilus biogenesis protein CpaD/CtpE